MKRIRQLSGPKQENMQQGGGGGNTIKFLAFGQGRAQLFSCWKFHPQGIGGNHTERARLADQQKEESVKRIRRDREQRERERKER
jgi:hypothetical protein